MIRIELTEEEWSRALNAIALAPYIQVAQLIEKIARQVQEQKQAEVSATNGKDAQWQSATQ
jgi:hypothetical protein